MVRASSLLSRGEFVVVAQAKHTATSKLLLSKVNFSTLLMLNIYVKIVSGSTLSKLTNVDRCAR